MLREVERRYVAVVHKSGILHPDSVTFYGPLKNRPALRRVWQNALSLDNFL